MQNKIIDITELRDTEHRILSYMVLSFDNIMQVNKSLNSNDFTFIVDQKIFDFLSTSEDLFKNMNFKEDINQSVEFIATLLDDIENIKADLTLSILSQIPSQDVQRDIEKIQNYSFEKDVSINKNFDFNEVEVEDKNGYIKGYFTNNRLIEVQTTNLFKLPVELCDNFADTMKHISTLELNSDDTKTIVSYYGDEKNPDGLASIHLKKDILSLKWFDNICKWADKYELDEDIFPRDRFKLELLKKLDISDKDIKWLPKEISKLENLRDFAMDNNQIKVLPLEVFKLKNLYRLSFLHNNISIIPSEIRNLNNLSVLGACDNNIKVLPDSFYSLNYLMIICLHGNQLTSISEDIGNFKKLKALSISNNNIRVLPNSISKLKLLESIDIENTDINDISSILMLHKLTNICCDDKFLSLLIENINNFGDINSINLSESIYRNDDEILKNKTLKIRTKKWMKEKDRQDNGCFVLSKCTIEKDIATIKEEYQYDKNLDQYNKKLLKIAFEIVEDEPFKSLDIFYEINDKNEVSPHEILDLSVDIICSIANKDIGKALELFDDVIDVDYYKLDALKRIDEKFENSDTKEHIKQIENSIIEYDPEYFERILEK